MPCMNSARQNHNCAVTYMGTERVALRRCAIVAAARIYCRAGWTDGGSGKRSAADTRLVSAEGRDADAYVSTRAPLPIRAQCSLASLSRSPSIRSSSASRMALVWPPPSIHSKSFATVVSAWVVSGSLGRGVARSCVRSASPSCASCSSRAHARATPGSPTPMALRQAVTSRATHTLSALRTSNRHTRHEFHDAPRSSHSHAFFTERREYISRHER
jgi:hypothetical protein